MKKNIFNWLVLIIILVSFVFLYQSRSIEQNIIEQRNIYIQENKALVHSVSKVKNSLVKIEVNGVESTGIILSRDGLILTFNKSLPYGLNYNISIDNKEYDYEIVKRDALLNLVLLKIENGELPAIEFVSEEEIFLGTKIFALTNDVVKVGIIESVNDVSISIKNFNAPIFDIEGRMVGMYYNSRFISINDIKSFSEFSN